MQTGEAPMRTANVPAQPVSAAHPMNSTRLLLDLLSLPGRTSGARGWDSIIHRNTLRSLMLALQHRDPFVVRHSRRVAVLGVGIAQHLGWEGHKLNVLEAACLLHDIGKVGLPDLILNKPARLTSDELEVVGLLNRIAGAILQAAGTDPEVVQVVTEARYHYNGADRGFQLIGSDMHLGARILTVADAYDSLVSPQVFREAHTHEQALEVLQRGAGSQFDGNVVATLCRWFNLKGIPRELAGISADQYQLRPEEVLEAGSLSHVFSYLYMLESLCHGFYLAGPDGRIRLWNSGLAEMTGIPWQKAAQQPALNQVQLRSRLGEALENGARPVFQALETRRAQTSELQLLNGDGEWVPVEIQTLPVFSESGQLHGFAEIFRDLSGNHEKGEHRDLRLMASRDALTHVANRGELKKRLDRQFKDWQDRHQQRPFSVIFADVDHFKRTNDTYGHAAGDEVLVNVARLLQQETYSGEMVARYGGEEFVILCPDTPLDSAFQKAERLRDTLAQAQVVQSNEFRVTASFGVAQVEPGDTPDSVLQRADKALYMSKHQGRNRTSRLTADELRNADPALVNPPLVKPDRYRFESRLRACVTSDMIIYKLKAFLDNQHAKLGRVSHERVEMKLGRCPLIPVWGSRPKHQPVRLTLAFGGERSSIQRGASRLVEITVTITPRGWPCSTTAFDKRARHIMKELREYFAADIADS